MIGVNRRRKSRAGGRGGCREGNGGAVESHMAVYIHVLCDHSSVRCSELHRIPSIGTRQLHGRHSSGLTFQNLSPSNTWIHGERPSYWYVRSSGQAREVENTAHAEERRRAYRLSNYQWADHVSPPVSAACRQNPERVLLPTTRP
jgi:hypothetical protein